MVPTRGKTGVPSARLTKRSVEALAPRATTYIAFDSELRGFGARVTPGGAKSWIVEYRPNGGGRSAPTRRLTIGPIATFSTEQARRAAKDLLARVRLGADPAAERAELRKSANMVELARRFMADEVRLSRKPRTVELYDSYLRIHVLPELGSKRARDVTTADATRLHRHIGEDAPVTANRVMVFLSGMFRWAAEQGEIPKDLNPFTNVTRYRERERERYLSTAEFSRLGDAIREAETIGLPYDVDESKPTAKHARKPENRRVKVDPYAAAAIRLLLFTGARLREILHLKWDRVDLQRNLIFLDESKNDAKSIVLNAPAQAVLAGLTPSGAYVIAGNSAGTDNEGPRADLNGPWRAIRGRANLGDVRIHDLRHSFASVGAGRSLGLPIIGKLLGHKTQESTRRYAHIDSNPLLTASNQIAGDIAEAIGEGVRRGGAVTPLRKGGR